jgi:hypothetical protein
MEAVQPSASACLPTSPGTGRPSSTAWGNCPPGSMSMSCNKLPLCAHRLEDQIHPMCGTAPSETPAHGLRLSATAWASRGR